MENTPAKANKTPLARNEAWPNRCLASRGHSPTSRSKRSVQYSTILDLREVQQPI
jgi:hypothetical protein